MEKVVRVTKRGEEVTEEERRLATLEVDMVPYNLVVGSRVQVVRWVEGREWEVWGSRGTSWHLRMGAGADTIGEVTQRWSVVVAEGGLVQRKVMVRRGRLVWQVVVAVRREVGGLTYSLTLTSSRLGALEVTATYRASMFD